MKFVLAVLAGAAVAVAQTQSLSSLPQCGQTCITNMIQIATSNFGCSQGNVTCYCVQPDFGYGVRDCANEACPNAGDAANVISYGLNYCTTALQSYSASMTGAMVTGSATSILAASNATAAVAGAGAATTAGAAGASSASASNNDTMSVVTSSTTALVVAGGGNGGSTTGQTTTDQNGRPTTVVSTTATDVVTPTGGSSGGAAGAGSGSSGSSSSSSSAASGAMATAVPGIFGAGLLALLAL